MTGYDGVACLCDEPLPEVCLADSLPESLLERHEAACELVLGAAVDPAHARRLLLRAARISKRAYRKAKRAGRHDIISLECSAELALGFQTLAGQAREYARSLPRP